MVTVARLREDYIERKGLDTFCLASRELPDLRFIIVGEHIHSKAVERVRLLGGPNLELAGRLSPEDLRSTLATCAVYLQPSLHEAFGCAVAEAMLSSCTPVVSNRGALPEVVGDAGYIIPARDAIAAAEAIRLALRNPRGDAARRRIAREFPRSTRRKALREHVRSILGHTD